MRNKNGELYIISPPKRNKQWKMIYNIANVWIKYQYCNIIKIINDKNANMNDYMIIFYLLLIVFYLSHKDNIIQERKDKAQSHRKL